MRAEELITFTCYNCGNTFTRDRRRKRFVGDADFERRPAQESVEGVEACSDDCWRQLESANRVGVIYDPPDRSAP